MRCTFAIGGETVQPQGVRPIARNFRGRRRRICRARLCAALARAHLLVMTVSMRVMSAGNGYEYLLRTVAAGDGDRSLSTPLTRYYTEEGTP